MTTIETLAEAQAILNLANHGNIASHFTSVFTFVDAMALTVKSTTDWYWTKLGNKLSFALPWKTGEPNNSNNLNEVCLSFRRDGFNDGPCNATTYAFLCQRIDFIVPKAL